MVSGDENIRLYFPILSAWLADQMENVNIHCIKVNRCAICVGNRDQLGILPKRPYSDHDHAAYERLWGTSENDRYVMQ
jgi:hypothetical protein